jgi:Bac_Flav_CT_N: Bacteroides conjugative transposon TraN protein
LPGKTVRTVYALPKFTIPDDKLLVVELYEKNGGRHQVIRVENADIVNAEVIDELKNQIGNEETHLYNDALCAVPDLVSGTRTKIPAGHERLAGHGGHGGRGTLERLARISPTISGRRTAFTPRTPTAG